MTMCAEFWEELGLDPANIIRLADATSWTTSPNAIDCAPKIAAQRQDRAIFRIAGIVKSTAIKVVNGTPARQRGQLVLTGLDSNLGLRHLVWLDQMQALVGVADGFPRASFPTGDTFPLAGLNVADGTITIQFNLDNADSWTLRDDADVQIGPDPEPLARWAKIGRGSLVSVAFTIFGWQLVGRSGLTLTGKTIWVQNPEHSTVNEDAPIQPAPAAAIVRPPPPPPFFRKRR